MATGNRNPQGKPTDLVFHIQHPDGVHLHSLCGRYGASTTDEKYMSFYGTEGVCKRCLKKAKR